MRPPDAKNMDLLLGLLEELIQQVPVYRMGCNISLDAARLARDTMQGGLR